MLNVHEFILNTKAFYLNNIHMYREWESLNVRRAKNKLSMSSKVIHVYVQHLTTLYQLNREFIRTNRCNFSKLTTTS